MLLFVLGWASRPAWATAWAEYLRPGLVDNGLLAGGDAAIGFNWGDPSGFVSSMLRPTSHAAGGIASLIAAHDSITLLGHSKGANLVLEYAARVAEGRLPPHPGLRRVIALNAPLDNWGGRIALGYFDRRRLVDLRQRLAVRGVDATLDLIYDPTDPVSCPATAPGVTCAAIVSGDASAGRWPIGSLEFWHPNHMACLREGWPGVLGLLGRR